MIFHIIDFSFAEDKGLILDGPLLKRYPSCQVLNILHDKIYRHTVVSKSWNDDISVDCCRKDEITVCLLDKFVVLL